MLHTRRESNGKKKGEAHAKCENKYLAWPFI
jgi:transposase